MPMPDTPAISASRNRSIQALDAMLRWWPDKIDQERQPKAAKEMVLMKHRKIAIVRQVRFSISHMYSLTFFIFGTFMDKLS